MKKQPARVGGLLERGESVTGIKELKERANAGEEMTEAEWWQMLRKAENTHSYVYEKYMKAAWKERKYLRAIGAWLKKENFAGMLVEMLLLVAIVQMFFI